jgi:glycosyltransferase involved in cell wall biosynthesis
MSAPLVSVCLITYNHVNYIREAIDGVIMQKVNFAWELIIADDFSTDGTREIVLDYKEKYPDLIKLILPNENTKALIFIDLISTPQSKYIAYLDGDDYWTDKYKLQKQVDFMEKNKEYSLCASRYKLIDENSKIIGEAPCLDPHNIHLSTYEDSRVIFSNYTLKDYLYYPYNIFQYSSVLFRNTVGLTHGIEEGFYGGDLLLSVNLLKNGPAYYFLDDYFSAYRIHPEGIWHKHANLQKAKLRLHDYKQLNKIIPEFDKEIRTILKCVYNELSIEYAKNGQLIYSLYNYFLGLSGKSDFTQNFLFKRFYYLIYYYKNNLIKN